MVLTHYGDPFSSRSREGMKRPKYENGVKNQRCLKDNEGMIVSLLLFHILFVRIKCNIGGLKDLQNFTFIKVPQIKSYM